MNTDQFHNEGQSLRRRERRRSNDRAQREGGSLQLNLFGAAEEGGASAEPAPKAAVAQPRAASRIPIKRPIALSHDAVRVVKIGDLPAYSREAIDAVDRVIKSISTDRVLLCYKEIQDYFGVSKSNVVRRLRAGMVPGVRLHRGRLIEEGPIRKLDREQVKWLLLSMRGKAG